MSVHDTHLLFDSRIMLSVDTHCNQQAKATCIKGKNSQGNIYLHANLEY